MITSPSADVCHLVDAHVHYHAPHQVPAFFESARGNFGRAAAFQAQDRPWLGYLLLADRFGDDSLAAIRAAHCGAGSDWTWHETQEGISRVARHGGVPRLVLVAGRQLQTAEGLEVLALGCAESFADGQPLEACLEFAASHARWTVLPWGFGKWWFGRGRVVARLLQAAGARRRDARCELFLGDNAGRAASLGQPRMFTRARQLGIRILPGSDDLALHMPATAAGSYGSVLAGPLDLEQPARHVRRLLHEADGQPPVFGGCQASLSRFCRRQLTLTAFRVGHRIPC